MNKKNEALAEIIFSIILMIMLLPIIIIGKIFGR